MKQIGITGGTKEFDEFLNNCYDGKIMRYETPEKLVDAAFREVYDAIIFLPEGNNPIKTFSFDSMRKLAKLRLRGQKLYIEYYDAGDYNSRGIFGYVTDTASRSVYNEVLNWNDNILQMRCGKFIPGRLAEFPAENRIEIATFENSIGVHHRVIPGDISFPGLVKCQTYLSATFPLTDFDRYTMLPHSQWGELYAYIFSWLLDTDKDKIRQVFNHVWEPIKLSGKESTVEDAIRKSICWLRNSGVMEDESGAKGIFEMIRSADLKVRRNQRCDSIALSAAVLSAAGKKFGDEELISSGICLADYFLSEKLQFEIGPNKGLYHWFNDLDVGPKWVYSSDSGRCALGMLQLYITTGEERFLRSAEMCADAFIRWTDGKPLMSKCFFHLDEANLETLTRDGVPHNAPSFYDSPVILMSRLWSITGDERYRHWVAQNVNEISKVYPNFTMNFTPKTYNLLYSRLLTILSSAQAIECGEYSQQINEVLYFFRKLQHTSGGFIDSSLIETDTTYNHPEFSVGMGSKYDSVVDNLYCTNNLLEALSIIKSLPKSSGVDIACATAMHKGLIHFVTSTQIEEPRAEIYGGWMRAFDLENNEYFGINKDKDWGPYCIMGGWVMGFLPLALIDDCGENTIFRIGK